MEKLLLLGLLCIWPLVCSGLTCYHCYYTLSVPDNVAEGYAGCADQNWNITEDDPVYVRDRCQACDKEYTYLDEERYAVVRSCMKTIYPEERMQDFNTCADIQLNTGNFTRCICDTDFCNARQECDSQYGCWDDPCPTCPSRPAC